jgi:hypothetical protein
VPHFKNNSGTAAACFDATAQLYRSGSTAGIFHLFPSRFFLAASVTRFLRLARSIAPFDIIIIIFIIIKHTNSTP